MTTAYTLRKVTSSQVGRGLAATTERTIWEAVRPDGSRITSGHATRKSADEAACEILAFAALLHVEAES